MSILVQAAVPDFREAKLTFDDPELVLHFGSDPRLFPVTGTILIRQLSVTAALCLGKVFGSGRVLREGLSLPAVRRIAQGSSFVAIEQVGLRLRIASIGGRRDNGMDQFCLAIYPDVRLHAEVPLVSLPGLVHLRLALLLLILGGTRRADRLASTMMPRETFIPFSLRY